MSLKERDAYTGHMTTGHDWNGIKELNTHVPKLLFFFLFSAIAFSVIYWILLPAWPGVRDHTDGVLDIDQRQEIKDVLDSAYAKQASWREALLSADLASIPDNPALATLITEAGPALFKDNCAMCHGQQGEGSMNFPALNDANWLWGHEPSAIYKTLQVGINSGATGSRVAMMPAFGDNGILDSTQIEHLVLFVQSLSNTEIGSGARAEELLSVNQGRTLFTTSCSACHGADGTGNINLGAPNLTDKHWLYGGSKANISHSITLGRGGLMPAWQQRLSDVELRVLTHYVLSLGNSP